MSDEKTREVPLTDVMGIAEVSDEPTETLPAVDDPGEAKTESFQKPFDGGPEAQRKFESQDEAESLETSGQDMRGSFAGRSARPTGSVKSADPAKSAEPVDPSKQVRIGKTDGELVIRPSGPSTGTIVLGVFFCLIGLMSMLCLLPIGAWRWMPNPSTLFFYVVGGLGALLLIISVVWADGNASQQNSPQKASSANDSAADTTTHVATMTWPDPMHAFPSFPISHRLPAAASWPLFISASSSMLAIARFLA